jgi:hypothetical protein
LQIDFPKGSFIPADAAPPPTPAADAPAPDGAGETTDEGASK